VRMNRIVQDREAITNPKGEGTDGPTARVRNLEATEYHRGQGAFHRTTAARRMERRVSGNVPASVRRRKFPSPAVVGALDRHLCSIASSWRSEWGYGHHGMDGRLELYEMLGSFHGGVTSA
jgi:hypothetical protein